jgi:hypothetical protein
MIWTAVMLGRRLDTRGFEDGGHDVDDMVELMTHAASILDMGVRARP